MNWSNQRENGTHLFDSSKLILAEAETIASKHSKDPPSLCQTGRSPRFGSFIPVFENFPDAPHQNFSSQIFCSTPTCFVFCDCLFK